VRVREGKEGKRDVRSRSRKGEEMLVIPIRKRRPGKKRKEKKKKSRLSSAAERQEKGLP